MNVLVAGDNNGQTVGPWHRGAGERRPLSVYSWPRIHASRRQHQQRTVPQLWDDAPHATLAPGRVCVPPAHLHTARPHTPGPRLSAGQLHVDSVFGVSVSSLSNKISGEFVLFYHVLK